MFLASVVLLLARGRLRGSLAQYRYVGDCVDLFVPSCCLNVFVQLCCCVYVFSFGCIALLLKMLLTFLSVLHYCISFGVSNVDFWNA